MREVALSRREVLLVLGALGFSAAGCGGLERRRESPAGEEEEPAPPIEPPPPDGRWSSNLRALMDTLLSGSVAAGAEQVLSLDNFVFLARAQGLLPGIAPDFEAPRGFDEAFHRLLNANLDLLAALQRPLTEFRRLPPELMEAAVKAGFEDPALAPQLTFVRAACFLAFLGAVHSDAGLVSIGFPPFEDFEQKIAVSGYPRVLAGGEVDDYTYNREPEPTPGDDLSLVIDPNGDFW
jgi:hypothetical protein